MEAPLRVGRCETAIFLAATEAGDGAENRRALDRRFLAATAIALCWPAEARAHSVVKTLGGFWAGVVHPFISLDQFGVLLALAIWIVWRPRHSEVFLAVLPLGAFLGAWSGPSIGAFSLLTPAAMALFGGMAATRADLSNVWLERLAAALGGIIIGITSAAGVEDASRGLFAFGVALTVASVTAYALLAARQAAGIPSWIEICGRSGAGVIAILGVGLFAVSSIGWIKL